MAIINLPCALPAVEAVATCMPSIPSVLTFYRKKEQPLMIRKTGDDKDGSDSDGEFHDGVDHRIDSDDENDHDHSKSIRGAVSASKAMPRSQSCTMQDRTSWSPLDTTGGTNSTRKKTLSFFSKYAPASTSTSSLSTLLAKTKQLTAPSRTRNDYTEEEAAMVDGHLPTEASCLSRPRDYFIVTTAALPWMTGTAVNPLLRAASISRHQRKQQHPEQTEQQSTKEQSTKKQEQHCPPVRPIVTLVIPWLDLATDRELLYGERWKDATQTDQEAYIRDWLATKANMPDEALPPLQGGIRILFYPARYHEKMSSIFAMGDLCQIIVTQHNLSIRQDAVCVLEEPEHIHYYRATSFREYFNFVVGVIHTNYKAYASTSVLGGSFITGPLVGTISSWLVRAYCDRVIKLSPVLQSFDCPEKETVCNVHGIRHDFMIEGERRAQSVFDGTSKKNRDRIYFVGKLLWAKGLDKLLELETLYRSMTGSYFEIDIYGSGPEAEDIEQAFLSERPTFLGGSPSYASTSALEELASASPCSVGSEVDLPPSTPTNDSTTNNPSNSMVSSPRLALASSYYSTLFRARQPVPAQFLGRKDHAELTNEYKIFVNPSITEVLCTTTAEATAMGKFVIVPDHPSNTFFHQFPNCLLYKSKMEFVDYLQYAITHEPEPLRPELIRQLTWEAATERFVKAAAITRRDAKWRERVGKTKSDEKIARMHYELGKGAKGDVLRKVLGGGPVADQFLYDCQQTQQAEEILATDSALPAVLVDTAIAVA